MTELEPQNIRNVAVIAHVDHGKTTLIDALLKQTKVFRENQHEMNETQILDSNTLERERGITISAKNCAITYRDFKINIIDTPGHADFSGEVERTLSMADGALLIIDAQEGPMPQTRFVLRKALELNLAIIVVINKIDKQYARIPYVIQKTESLFLELARKDEQLNFPIMYAVAREGSVYNELPTLPTSEEGSVIPLLDKIIEHVPSPQNNIEGVFKMVISTLDYDAHQGQIVIGKVHSGVVHPKQKVILAHERYTPFTIERVLVSQGLSRIEITDGTAGDIIALTGIQNARIGNTITDPADPTPLPASTIGEPTLHMYLGPNTSPLSGKEGEFTTTRQIETRLNKELETNLSLRVVRNSNGTYTISGRGELHLAILIETLRREGFELEIGKPEVITKQIDGVESEPIEELSIIVPQSYVGTISQELGKRFAHLVHMNPVSETEMEFVYNLPTRSIIGLRGSLLTLTKGTVVVSSQLIGYEPLGKSLPKLRQGVLIADGPGEALSYGLQAVQKRGTTFISAGTSVYEGMIIGQSLTDKDIAMNVCKGKKLTNMRSSSSDMNIQLAPATILSLEQSIDFLEQDELLEITPKSLRLRKRFLTENERRKTERG